MLVLVILIHSLTSYLTSYKNKFRMTIDDISVSFTRYLMNNVVSSMACSTSITFNIHLSLANIFFQSIVWTLTKYKHSVLETYNKILSSCLAIYSVYVPIRSINQFTDNVVPHFMCINSFKCITSTAFNLYLNHFEKTIYNEYEFYLDIMWLFA